MDCTWRNWILIWKLNGCENTLEKDATILCPRVFPESSEVTQTAKVIEDL